MNTHTDTQRQTGTQTYTYIHMHTTHCVCYNITSHKQTFSSKYVAMHNRLITLVLGTI